MFYFTVNYNFTGGFFFEKGVNCKNHLALGNYVINILLHIILHFSQFLPFKQ